MPSSGRTSRHASRRTNMDRAHRASLIASFVLLCTALVAVALGGYAWGLDRNPSTRVSTDAPVSLGETPVFDPGVTIFVREADLEGRRTADWGCTLSTSDGDRPITRRGDIERTGTRVQDDVALVPALVVGRTSSADLLTCPDLPEGVAAWTLPSEPGHPRIPMVLVIGGVALAGLGALVHPRARGLARFG